MLLIFVMVIFLLLHIQFYVRNLLFGTDEATYFIFTIKYGFDSEIAKLSLIFATACAISFGIGYLATYKQNRIINTKQFATTLGPYQYSLWPLLVSGLVQVIASFSLAIQSNFQYQTIAENLESSGFILELRVIFLLFLAHLLFNVPIRQVLYSPRYKLVRKVIISYIVAAVILQARSRIFEVGAVLVFTQLMWVGDLFRWKYLLALGSSLIVPNVLVLGRLGWPKDISTLFDGLFSFEYTILFNNLLSASIEAGVGTDWTFISSLQLLLPSPIRSLLELDVVKSSYYTDLAEIANIKNGGFSLLAELFTNFGWYSPLIIGLMGMIIGSLNAGSRKIGKVSLVSSAAPLFYTAFILAFRNDLGVFIKYSVQLFIIAGILQFFFRRRVLLKNAPVFSQPN